MNYTKGEWKVNKNYMGTYTIHTDDAHIADVDRHFNAQLIASAPSLCAVLEQVVVDYKEFARTGDGNLFDERLGADIEDAETALAKVEGK